MIYLSVDGLSGLGEDTWWTWMQRMFNCKHETPARIGDGDVIIRNSILGRPPEGMQVNSGATKIAVFWELHPEMVERGVPSGSSLQVVEKQRQAAAWADICVTHTNVMLAWLEDETDARQIKYLPIGVDAELFQRDPSIRSRKNAYFWSGTMHPMKGYEHVKRFARDNQDADVICVWKTSRDFARATDGANRGNLHHHRPVDQEQLVRLMSRCRSFLSTSALRPWYMVEWEAMAVGLEPIYLSGGDKEFTPDLSAGSVIEGHGWSRDVVKVAWESLLQNQGAVWQ